MKELKRLREISGLTQATLARRAGVDRSMISMAEGRQLTLRKDQQDSLRAVLMAEIKAKSEIIQSLAKGAQAEAVPA